MKKQLDPFRSLMEARPGMPVRLVLSLAGACAFFFFLPAGGPVAALCVLALLAVGAYETREQSLLVFLCTGLFLAMTVAVHVSLLSVRSARLSRVLVPMLRDMWNYDLIGAMAWEEGSWSGGYLILLGLLSRFESDQVAMIKLINLVFVTGGALALWRLSSQRGAALPGRMLTLSVGMILPTVVLNSGCWGQCDAIYACLALWGLSLLLDRHSAWGCLLLGLSVGFKLQGAFLLPLLIPMYIEGRVSLRHLLLGLAGLAALHLPMVLDGQELLSILSRYSEQLTEAAYGSVGLGDHAPGIYGLMNIASVREFSGMGMFLALALALLLALFLARRLPQDNETWLLAAVVLCLGLPLILPQMNVRCLYLAGLLALPLAASPKQALQAVLIEVISLCGYMQSIFSQTILPLTLLSIGAIVLLLFTVAQLLDRTELRHA